MAPRDASRAQGRGRAALVLTLYVAVASIGIGRHALGSPSTVCACFGETGDPPFFMWALEWWPWAITHGVNPFVSHFVWAPQGIDVATTTAIPAAAVALAPVTLMFGPFVSYNVLTVLAPALAAFTAYRLCLRLTGRTLPAIAGGYLFGFGSFVIAHSLGHANLILVFPIPLAVELVLVRMQGAIGRRRFVVLLALVIAVQVGLSTELLADSVLMAAALLVAAAVFSRESRARLKPLTAEIVAAGVTAALLASPYLYYALFGSRFPRGPGFGASFGIDAVSPVAPTIAMRVGRQYFAALTTRFTDSVLAESTGYLTLPLAIGFVVFAVRGWRRPATRVIVSGMALAIVAALGSYLYIGGVRTIPLPWRLVNGKPLFDFMVPARYMVFAQLALATGISLWLASAAATARHAAARRVVLAAGVVLLWPNTSSDFWHGRRSTPRFFRTAAIYERYIAKHSTALVIPTGADGASMLWQAETGMYFRLAGGYTGRDAPPPFNSDPAFAELTGAAPANVSDLRSFIRAHDVRTILIQPAHAGGWTAIMAALAIPVGRAGGMLVYRVPPRL